MHTIPAPHIEDTENPIGPEPVLSISTAEDHLVPSLSLSVPGETKRIAYACYAIILRGASRQTCQLGALPPHPSACLLTLVVSSRQQGKYTPQSPISGLRTLDSVSTVRGANALPPASRAGGLIWNVHEGITMPS